MKTVKVTARTHILSSEVYELLTFEDDATEEEIETAARETVDEMLIEWDWKIVKESK